MVAKRTFRLGHDANGTLAAKWRRSRCAVNVAVTVIVRFKHLRPPIASFSRCDDSAVLSDNRFQRFGIYEQFAP